MLPHLEAAHNLARWLLRHPDDAQDAVQEAFLRAFQYFDSYRDGDAKAWLLAIVRKTCFNWRRRGKRPLDARALRRIRLRRGRPRNADRRSRRAFCATASTSPTSILMEGGQRLFTAAELSSRFHQPGLR